MDSFFKIFLLFLFWFIDKCERAHSSAEMLSAVEIFWKNGDKSIFSPTWKQIHKFDKNTLKTLKHLWLYLWKIRVIKFSWAFEQNLQFLSEKEHYFVTLKPKILWWNFTEAEYRGRSGALLCDLGGQNGWYFWNQREKLD